MEADPLYHVKQLFYQASYKAAITEASSQSYTPSSDPTSLQRAIYLIRSHLAFSPPNVNEASMIISPYQSLDPIPLPIKALSSLINYLKEEGGANEKEQYVEEVRDSLLELEDGDEFESIVRVVAATIFIKEGEHEEAVATLTEGAAREDLECTALLVQLLLLLDRRDLAQSTYAAAKRIGNDSTLVQAIEAWIGLKTGSRPLHQSYYFYEELYQLPSGRTPPVLASHAAAHLLLGHIDEAKSDIIEASNSSNGLTEDVLAVGTSLGIEGYSQKLSTTAPNHPFAKDLAEKNKAFDEAAAKFAITA